MDRNLTPLQPAWSNVLTPFLGQFFNPPDFFQIEQPAGIRVDVKESDKQYEIQAEIAGVKKDDIKVRIDGSYVQIDAHVDRESEEKDKAGKVIRSERYYGSVSRSLNLAHDIDAAHAQAKYKDGVLNLTLPKRGDTQASQLQIQ
jgi:HSP20 family protein